MDNVTAKVGARRTEANSNLISIAAATQGNADNLKSGNIYLSLAYTDNAIMANE